MESPDPTHADRAVHHVPEDAVEIVDFRPEHREYQPPRYEIRQRKRLALGLFLGTVLCTWLTGIIMFPGNRLLNGLIYSAGVVSILAFHEMGHYLQSRRYGVPASLPYFIPLPPPLSLFGTMGAVILQGPGANRKSLFDIAISGPLAGLVLALPIAWIGIDRSVVEQIIPGPGYTRFGDPLILKWMVEWKHGPIPADHDVMLNPLVWAGWVGVFVTALNLIPIGQLDGGHILYAILRKWARPIAVALLLGAVAYMAFTRNYAYMLMAGLVAMSGPRHPPTSNDNMELGWPRIILGWLTLAFIIIGFTPVPIISM